MEKKCISIKNGSLEIKGEVSFRKEGKVTRDKGYKEVHDKNWKEMLFFSGFMGFRFISPNRQKLLEVKSCIQHFVVLSGSPLFLVPGQAGRMSVGCW